jgi:hypothetical protein
MKKKAKKYPTGMTDNELLSDARRKSNKHRHAINNKETYKTHRRWSAASLREVIVENSSC